VTIDSGYLDFAIKNKRSNYYIGTLVVLKRKSDEGYIYAIDGQQKAYYLKNI
jgi:hypothetical protein